MESLEKQEVKSSEKANELLSFDKVVSTSANSNDDDIFRADEGHKSKKTAVNYRNNFRLFLKFIKIYDLQVLLDLGKEAIQELVTRYAKAMRDDPIKKYSYNTVHNRMSAIFYFFENNDIELNKRKIRRYYPPDESMNNDKLYTEEQTRKILSVCDLRTKAMIYLMLSSGCRIGSLHTMLVKDLISVSYQGQYLYKVRVYARTRDEYFSFVTPEAKTEGIDPYLDYRRRCGEKLTDEAPLFRKQFNRSVLINTPYPLSQDAVMK